MYLVDNFRKINPMRNLMLKFQLRKQMSRWFDMELKNSFK